MSRRVRIGLRALLCGAVLAIGVCSPTIAAGPNVIGAAVPVGTTTTQTTRYSVSTAECAAIRKLYAQSDCIVVVTNTQTSIPVPTGQSSTAQAVAGVVSPAVLIDQSPCSTHSYAAGTNQEQMVMNGVWSYTLWVQWERDAVCGDVEYQKTKCYQDWGILWTVTDHECGALPAGLMVWRWWGDPSYAYADYTMTETIPFVGGVLSVGHHGWLQVNGITGKVSTGWGG